MSSLAMVIKGTNGEDVLTVEEFHKAFGMDREEELVEYLGEEIKKVLNSEEDK